MKGFGKTTRYFIENVLKKRPYIKPEWIERARAGDYVAKKIQPDGRVRVWVYISEEEKNEIQILSRNRYSLYRTKGNSKR